jgi:hypothetical protein
MIHRIRLSLHQQITGLALLAALFATATVAVLVALKQQSTSASVSQELDALTVERVTRSIEKARSVCELAQAYIQKAVNTNLNVARATLMQAGGIRISAAPMAWQATNQYTQVTTPVTAPTWTLSGQPLTANRSFQHRIPVVDEVTEKTGETMTIFQRLSPAGDMLRVATSVAATDGQRAIGTYIPAVMSDGTSNPVVQSVLGGQTYRGRAFVVNAWYITAYEPLFDAQHNVIGMIYVGVKQEGVSSLSDAITFAGWSGARSSISIYYGKESQRSSNQPVVRPTGLAADTESQWLPTVLSFAPTITPTETRGITVTDPKTHAQTIVRYVYYQPWDWIIAVAADSRDFEGPTDRVRSQFHVLLLETLAGGLVAVAISAIFAAYMSRRITNPLADLSVQLTSNATQIASSAIHQQSSVTEVLSSSNQIASAVNEISATSRELLRTMIEIADAADKTAALAREGRQGLKEMQSSMLALSNATGSISGKLTTIRNKAARINNVVTAITKVADQTNLLSLNAAIEAEKAGEAGAGFAVVAREIRRLADQSAVATLDIEQMVEEMQDAVSTGVEEMSGLSDAVQTGISSAESIRGQFGEIIERVEYVAPRFETVQLGMSNQTEGAAQIGEAMAQLTQTARQTSDSVTDLNEVSQQLHHAVRVLKVLIFKLNQQP